ncbi:hypothetical protein ACMFMG_000262 [Clarireedia jacksonii]
MHQEKRRCNAPSATGSDTEHDIKILHHVAVAAKTAYGNDHEESHLPSCVAQHLLHLVRLLRILHTETSADQKSLTHSAKLRDPFLENSSAISAY